MTNLKLVLASSAVAALLAGCAGVPHVNAYSNVPIGNYFVGDTVPTAAYFKAQDDFVIPHCETVAEETNPSEGRMAFSYGTNHGVTGVIAEAGAMEAEGAIIGTPFTAPVVAGVSVNNGINAGTQAAMSGVEAHDQQVNGWTKNCVMAHTGGYRSVAPSERSDIEHTGHSASLEKAIAADPDPYAGEHRRPPGS